VSAAVPPLVSQLLDGTGLVPSDAAVAMHPGGPKVLAMSAAALGLSRADFEVSWDFLAVHGNTSGSSNLALLHNELLKGAAKGAARPRHILCLGIGPGLALEGVLLARIPANARGGQEGQQQPRAPALQTQMQQRQQQEAAADMRVGTPPTPDTLSASLLEQSTSRGVALHQ
jgi:hypothetical protein